MKQFINHATILDFFLKDNGIILKVVKCGSNKFRQEWI